MHRITRESKINAVYGIIFLTSKDWIYNAKEESNAILRIGVASALNADARMKDSLKVRADL